MNFKKLIRRNTFVFYFLKKTRDSIYKLITDEQYIKLQYRKKIGKKLDLENPQTFNEKLQWLKINWRTPSLTTCADKYEARNYVQEKLGKEVLNELYGVYEDVNDIDISSLPNTFVMKVNHGSGQNIFCENKNDFNFKKAFKEINRYLKYNNYLHGREWAYKNIKPLIIIEKYLDDNGKPPNDYKFFCFNGKPEFIQMDVDRFGSHSRNIYNLDWELMDFKIEYNQSKTTPRPTNLKDMINYASILSQGFPFVRVDFYNFNNKVYFGEMTFYPGNGNERFHPAEYDKKIGSKIKLSI